MAKRTYTAEEQSAATTINGVAPADVTADPEAPAKPRMVDDRSDKERLADIRRATDDRKVSLAREIELGKPTPIHPIVITDLDFVLGYVDRLEKKVRLYEKNLEPVEV